jgi:predicted dehydrogenase
MSTKNSSKKLRVGIVGAGGIVKQKHLPGLQALPNVEIVAVCNSHPDSAQAVAKEQHP